MRVEVIVDNLFGHCDEGFSVCYDKGENQKAEDIEADFEVREIMFI